jgi:hypothetical protein
VYSNDIFENNEQALKGKMQLLPTAHHRALRIIEFYDTIFCLFHLSILQNAIYFYHVLPFN